MLHLRYCFLILILFFSGLQYSWAKDYVFDFNSRCQKAYQAILSLKIEEGRQLLQEELKQNPYNLIPVMLQNYEDCLVLLFNGEPEEYRKRKPNLDKRLAALDKGPSNSPWYRYSKAVMHFQWAAVRIRFDEYFNAGTGFRRSYLLLTDNAKRYPNFQYNQVLLGLEEALVGTVPDNYKWVANMLGLKGDVKKGTAKIFRFINSSSISTPLRDEAIVYYCYLRANLLSEKKEAMRFLDNSQINIESQLLFTFIKTNIALADNQATLAETTLKNRNTNRNYLRIPLLDYQMGVALMQRLDSSCVAYFEKFLTTYKGNIFAKDACQKISLFYVSQGNFAEASKYKNKINQVGNLQFDADKQAQRYAGQKVFPNPDLLQARLLCDGGYFQRALDILTNKKLTDFTEVGDKLEFTYRYARIYTLSNQHDRAIPYYEATIRGGRNRQEHFAARAALELGYIYEKKGNKQKAIQMYKDCLSMKNHDYKSSLDQRAKAGLNRLQ